MTLGAIVFKKYKFKIYRKKQNIKNVDFFEKLLILVLGTICVPIISFYFLRFIKLFSLSMDFSFYRAGIFGIYGVFPLFGSAFRSSAYFIYISPLVLVSLFYGFSFLINFKRKKLIFLSLILLIMETIMILGRFGFHYIIIGSLCLILSYFIIPTPKKTIQKSLKFTLTNSLLVIVIVLSISVSRDIPIKSVFNHSLLIYHTESFNIFQNKLNNSESVIHQPSYGLSTIAGLENIILFTLSSLDFEINKISEASKMGIDLGQNEIIGLDSNGNKLGFNAFGTILFALYRDGGIIYILFYGFLYGYSLMHFTKRLRHRNPLASAILINLVFIGFYGLFQPVLSGPFEISLIIIIFINAIYDFYEKTILT